MRSELNGASLAPTGGRAVGDAVHYLHRLSDLLFTGLLLLFSALLLGGCSDDAAQTVATTQSTDASETPKIASISPAATDLLLGMGAGDRLVAVNDHDTDPRVADLPRVGGYTNFDWEKLAEIRPDAIVVQVAPENLPAGAKDNAQRLGVRFVNVQIRRLEDIRAALLQLADLAELDRENAIASWDAAIEKTIQRDPATRPSVLILLNDDLTFAVGRGNYLDDLIHHVGGTNALSDDFTAWPQIDRETLRTLEPDVVVLILAGATDAQRTAARRAWDNAGVEIPWKNVHVITDAYAMIPGWRVTELAAKLRDALAERSQ